MFEWVIWTVAVVVGGAILIPLTFFLLFLIAKVITYAILTAKRQFDINNKVSNSGEHSNGE